MRWFKVKPHDALVGEVSLDTLKKAFEEVLAQYQSAQGRRPTPAEWEALLTVMMDRWEVGVVKSVKIDLATADAHDDENEAPKPPKKSSPLH